MYPYGFRPKRDFVDMNLIFIAMPFHDDFESVYTDLIRPSVKKVNEIRVAEGKDELELYRAKDVKHTRSGLHLASTYGWPEILEKLHTARIVLGVLAGDNPDVFYELGIAHATQQIERQILIAPKDYNPKFDLKDLIFREYDPQKPSESIDDLSDAIIDTLRVYKKMKTAFYL